MGFHKVKVKMTETDLFLCQFADKWGKDWVNDTQAWNSMENQVQERMKLEKEKPEDERKEYKTVLRETSEEIDTWWKNHPQGIVERVTL